MTKTIASIYYMPLTARRPLYQGNFDIPAVARGERPFLLPVRDHYQWETLPWSFGYANGRQRQERRTILGEHIAADLLREWTASHPKMNPQCGPGVWIVRDCVYLFDPEGKPIMDAEGKQAFRPATNEEREKMFEEDLRSAIERQSAWAEVCIREGDAMADDLKKIPFIPEYCRQACHYYGRDRKWLHELKDGDVKTCVFCTKVIAANAIKCPHCSEVVDFEAYAKLLNQRKAAENAVAKNVIRPPLEGQNKPSLNA
jgi:hypothetical protein